MLRGKIPFAWSRARILSLNFFSDLLIESDRIVKLNYLFQLKFKTRHFELPVQLRR